MSEKERAVDLTWVKSSFSGNNHPTCVEAARLPNGNVAVRNSNDPDGSQVVYTDMEWVRFLQGVRNGEFDL